MKNTNKLQKSSKKKKLNEFVKKAEVFFTISQLIKR